MGERKSTSSRHRSFATVLYPFESAPDNWLDIIAELKIPVYVSPLHDQDKNPTGEPKKPHVHVLMYFEGKKSIEQVQEIVKTFGGVGVEVVSSLRGYARYLCHLDNPEKAQYDISQVRCYGGANYHDICNLAADKYKAIREMKDFCLENNILAYCDLFDYACDNREDWFVVLCDNGTYVMKEYLKSKSWKRGLQNEE